MGRQNMRVSPSQKHMHVYQRFDGGLNTVDANEKIADNELANLINKDLGERGSLKRRHGMVKHIQAITATYGQGYFRYFKEGIGHEEIVAQNGYLYLGGVQQTIVGLAQFQTTRPIEAVQYKDKLYIATGTKLVSYDGTTFTVVEPYKPIPLEALYIGTNGLADNPNDFLSDGVSLFSSIEGVTFDKRYGVVNEFITITAFVSKPVEDTLEYLFERRMTTDLDGVWMIGQDWSTLKTYDFSTSFSGDMQVRVRIREVSTTLVLGESLVPKYKINPVPDPNDVTVPDSTITTCNRIVLHWERLILYGDTSQPDAIFISHNRNPDYFPIPNSLIFESERREQVTSIVRFRDMLVVFTPSTIQALYGKSPMDFRRLMLNSSIGCIAPYSTAIVGNYIAFLSNEGVHFLKSVGYNETRMNVEKIDTNIDNIMLKDTNASGMLIDNQYMLLFPTSKLRFRYYYETKAWTKDESDKLDFTRMYEWDGELYGQSSLEGSIYKFDKTKFDDAGFVYTDTVETKYYDFSEPYHDKKLKELQLILSSDNQRSSISVLVYADATMILGTDTSYSTIDADGNVDWVAQNEPNVIMRNGTVLGEWVMGESPFGEVASAKYSLGIAGRCRTMKMIIMHEEATPMQLLGLGTIFKTKKP